MSKALEALDRIKNNKYSHTIIATNPPIDKDSENRAEDYKVIQKELTKYEILINKEVNIHHLNWCIDQAKGNYEKFKSLYCHPSTPGKDYGITEYEFCLLSGKRVAREFCIRVTAKSESLIPKAKPVMRCGVFDENDIEILTWDGEDIQRITHEIRSKLTEKYPNEKINITVNKDNLKEYGII